MDAKHKSYQIGTDELAQKSSRIAVFFKSQIVFQLLLENTC